VGRYIAGCCELYADVCFIAAIHCALLMNHLSNFRSINCVGKRTAELVRGSDMEIDLQIRFN
jgi:hypothetical protein